MSSINPIDKDLSGTNRIEATRPITAGAPSAAPLPTSEFQSILEKTPMQASPGAGAKTESPFDIFEKGQGKGGAGAGGTLDSILNQITTTHTTLDDISGQIKNNPNLKLKQGENRLLRDKLSDASAHMRAANEKMGIDPGPPVSVPAGAKPLERFLSFVADGQKQMEAAKTEVNNLSASGDTLTPASFMTIQVKLSKAQQQLEFSSMVLGKAVEGLKNIMAVQI